MAYAGRPHTGMSIRGRQVGEEGRVLLECGGRQRGMKLCRPKRSPVLRGAQLGLSGARRPNNKPDTMRHKAAKERQKAASTRSPAEPWLPSEARKQGRCGCRREA